MPTHRFENYVEIEVHDSSCCSSDAASYCNQPNPIKLNPATPIARHDAEPIQYCLQEGGLYAHIYWEYSVLFWSMIRARHPMFGHGQAMACLASPCGRCKHVGSKGNLEESELEARCSSSLALKPDRRFQQFQIGLRLTSGRRRS